MKIWFILGVALGVDLHLTPTPTELGANMPGNMVHLK